MIPNDTITGVFNEKLRSAQTTSKTKSKSPPSTLTASHPQNDHEFKILLHFFSIDIKTFFRYELSGKNFLTTHVRRHLKIVQIRRQLLVLEAF